MPYQGLLFAAFLVSVIATSYMDGQLGDLIYDHNQFDAVFTSLLDQFLIKSEQITSFLVDSRGRTVPSVGTHKYTGHLNVHGKKEEYRAFFVKSKETVGDQEVITYDVQVNGCWYDSGRIFRAIKDSIIKLENNTIEVLHISTASFKMDVRSLCMDYRTPKPHQKQAANEIVKRFKRDGNVGVLLHGPPGTGKTTTAHVVKKSLDQDKGLNMKSQLYHNFNPSTTVDVATILESAKHAPVIIVIDEIDQHFKTAITEGKGPKLNPKPTYVDSKQSFNGMLDLIRGTRNVILVATTNAEIEVLQNTYPSFMRDGRFDDHVHMGTKTSRIRTGQVKED